MAAWVAYAKCLCMRGMMGCSWFPFISRAQSRPWLVAHAKAAAKLQANDLKTAAAPCRIICKKKKGCEDINAICDFSIRLLDVVSTWENRVYLVGLQSESKSKMWLLVF